MNNNLQLRDVQPDDLSIFFVQQLDADATRMAAFPSRDRTAFDAHWANNILGNPMAVTRTVLCDDNIAGYIGSWQQDGLRFVGYWFGKAYWGKGLATESLARFLAIVTERPLYAYVAKHNVPSLRVLEKCGFKLEQEDESEVSGEVALILG